MEWWAMYDVNGPTPAYKAILAGLIPARVPAGVGMGMSGWKSPGDAFLIVRSDDSGCPATYYQDMSSRCERVASTPASEHGRDTHMRRILLVLALATVVTA